MSGSEFRRELVKIMPGYKWTVHKTSNPERQDATGTQSSGFNRLSTLRVIRFQNDRSIEYEVKSAGYGTKSPWASTVSDRTLARALRGLQDYYERKSQYFGGLAACMKAGRLQRSSDR